MRRKRSRCVQFRSPDIFLHFSDYFWILHICVSASSRFFSATSVFCNVTSAVASSSPHLLSAFTQVLVSEPRKNRVWPRGLCRFIFNDNSKSGRAQKLRTYILIQKTTSLGTTFWGRHWNSDQERSQWFSSSSSSSHDRAIPMVLLIIFFLP